ncbi:hypothetical protein [Sulfitobacter sp. SK012]|uniref:hypothetical protein n=1 Tax=Sulfitobacter sp. SK012 TaxID=1389005 RepID=UPI0013B415ED|nr:hypothetical protein [Sulfitobacter sp. SK012]
MSDFPATPQTQELTAKKTPELSGLLRRASNWFWKMTNDAKDMNIKPFDGIL